MTRRIIRYGLALVLPLASGFFAFLQLREEQPLWGGRMADPSYTYLLSSLDLATFTAPAHVDHPGTPVQIVGALVLRARHPLQTSEALASTVLADPEPYAHAISVVLITLAVLASAAAGLWVLQRTDNLGALFATQIGSLLTVHVLAGYGGVRPEPLLITCTHLWIAVWILWGEGVLDLERHGTRLAVAALGGFAVAIKITFAPLLVIPFVLLRDWRSRLQFGLASAAALFIAILPALARWRRIASWFLRLAAHEGAYGSGPLSLAPQSGWLRALRDAFLINHVFAAMLVLTFAVLAWRWTAVLLTEKAARHRRLALAVALALGASLLMVAKQAHGAGRYLLAASLCGPLALFALWQWCASAWPIAVQRGLGGALLVLAATLTLPAARAQLDEVRRERLAAIEARAWIQHQLAGETVVPYYGASSPEFSLAQGDLEGHWARTLAQLYPGFTWFELWTGKFKRNFSSEPAPPPAGRYYLQGAPLAGGVLAQQQPLPGTTEAVWSSANEAIYRVTSLGSQP